MTDVAPIALFLVSLPLLAAAWFLLRGHIRNRDRAFRAHVNMGSQENLVEECFPMPLVVFDARGLVRRLNPAAERQFGFTERELYGQTILRLMSKRPETSSGIIQMRHRDGTLIPVRFSLARAGAWSGQVYLFLDKIAEQPDAAAAAAEPVIIQEAKPSLAAVEGVVNRIVSQFEGLLTTINGYAELAMHEAPPGSPILSDLKELAAASDTASSLARNLLAFSGSQTIPTELVDLNALVGAMEPAIREAVKGPLQIERGPERAAVIGNSDCLRQVILLLVRSAHHRTARGTAGHTGGTGSIRVASGRHSLAEAKPVYTGKLPAGEYCLLTVSDSGPALGAATLEHLFEPLFLDAEAVGVELAPVYGIVRSLGGWIDANHESGDGNLFEVYFPYAGDIRIGTTPGKSRAMAG